MERIGGKRDVSSDETKRLESFPIRHSVSLRVQ